MADGSYERPELRLRERDRIAHRLRELAKARDTRPTRPLVLASGSPRRAKILSDMGLSFEILKTDAPEVSLPEAPEETVRANADHKLRAAAAALARQGRTPAILAADTIVWHDGRIYGKPRDLDEAAEFLRRLSGQTHTVFTGLAFMPAGGGETKTTVCRSDVTFRTLTADDIAAYVADIRPLDRAGAYDIDASGDRLVAGWTGSYENIMGLPREPVRDWLAK